MKKKKIIIKTASALQKIFPDEKRITEEKAFSVFQNETFSFQVCCYANEFVMDLELSVQSKLSEYITVRRIDCVPCRFAKFETRCDDFYIPRRGNNQLYPDVLRPIREKEVLRPFEWTCFYVTLSGKLPVGDFDVRITARGDSYIKFEKTVGYRLRVLEGELPPHDLFYTEWIHYDCICDKHGVQPFTDEFYDVTNAYLRSALKRGQNAILTPLFTPPLDTEIGIYRRTVQLVEVREEEGKYFFSFDKVKRFFDNALDLGFEHFEIAHLASQWGAIKCPRIQIWKDGSLTDVFGWEEDSCGEEYLRFLDEFSAAFAAFAKENGYTERLYFHISDEPSKKCIDRISTVRRVLKKHFPNNPIMDALNDREYVEGGIVDMPFVPVMHHKDLPSPYVYSCNMMRKEYVPNRFLCVPPLRTRILGMQLYRNEAKGYLHWAFNFYHSIASRYPVDPYAVTDGDGTFDGGDAFVVYPTDGGVLESLRYGYLQAGFQDLRALRYLESLRGRKFVEELLSRYGLEKGYSISLRKNGKFSALRLKINEEIEKAKNELK